MNKSENIGALAKALAAAQSEMKAAKKGNANPFYKSKYADLATIWDVIRAPLAKQGIAVLQTSSTTIVDGKVGVTVTTMLAHESGEWIEDSLTLFPKAADPQSIGGAVTYGRRYGLSVTGAVAEDEDDDGNTANGKSAMTADQADASFEHEQSRWGTAPAKPRRVKPTGIPAAVDEFLGPLETTEGEDL